MSWIDDDGSSSAPSGVPTSPSPSRGRNRHSRRSRPTMWWVGWGMAVGGAVAAWILVAVGSVPESPDDTASIAIVIAGIGFVFVSVLGFGLYQDAAFQSGTSSHEPAWRPSTIARFALLAAFIAGGYHAYRIADLIARQVVT